MNGDPTLKKLYIDRDSVTLNSDKTFTYVGTLEKPGILFLLTDFITARVPVWISGGKINISLEEYVQPGLNNTSNKFLRIVSIKGSKETEAYNKLQQSLIEIAAKYPKRSTLGDDSIKLGYFLLVKNYIKKNKDSYFSAFLANDYPFTLTEKKELLLLTKNNPSKENIENLKASIKQLELVKRGNIVPDFSQPSTDGKRISLYSLKSRFILIQFWASWCAPCRWENPQFMKLYSKYHPKGDLEIIDVSLDTEDSAWKQAIAQDHLPWINVSDLKGWQNSIAKKYIVTPHVPFNILIDNSHSIISSELWPSQVGDILEKYLGR